MKRKNGLTRNTLHATKAFEGEEEEDARKWPKIQIYLQTELVLNTRLS